MTTIHYTECDGCKKKMEDGCGNMFTLLDQHCMGCGGEEQKHFCSVNCMKVYIEKLAPSGKQEK